jgi:hypothetical protein
MLAARFRVLSGRMRLKVAIYGCSAPIAPHQGRVAAKISQCVVAGAMHPLGVDVLRYISLRVIAQDRDQLGMDLYASCVTLARCFRGACS